MIQTASTSASVRIPFQEFTLGGSGADLFPKFALDRPVRTSSFLIRERFDSWGLRLPKVNAHPMGVRRFLENQTRVTDPLFLSAAIDHKAEPCFHSSASASFSDPYASPSRAWIRPFLKICLEYGYPVQLITGYPGINKDLDLWAELGRQQLARVFFYIPGTQEDQRRIHEPQSASYASRWQALEKMAKSGIPTGIYLGMAGAQEGRELQAMLAMAKSRGAFWLRVADREISWADHPWTWNQTAFHRPRGQQMRLF